MKRAQQEARERDRASGGGCSLGKGEDLGDLHGNTPTRKCNSTMIWFGNSKAFVSVAKLPLGIPVQSPGRRTKGSQYGFNSHTSMAELNV
jgi:hypothetical protein